MPALDCYLPTFWTHMHFRLTTQHIHPMKAVTSISFFLRLMWRLVYVWNKQKQQSKFYTWTKSGRNNTNAFCHSLKSSGMRIAVLYKFTDFTYTVCCFSSLCLASLVTVTEALVLCPLLEDRGRITESICILVPVYRMKQKVFRSQRNKSVDRSVSP